MKTTVRQSERLKESCIEARHPSGLTIRLFPMPGYSSACAMLGTRYGSIDRTFQTPDDPDFVTVPDGIAHYLEHKLFESEEGDAFSLFAQTGASANAYTSFDRTAYYFSATDRFEDSLRVLLGFVQSPYFTDETVQKEQGIIGQEIRMYDDDPGWQVLFRCLRGMYQKHPVRIDIAGTVESIAQIDKDLLYRCYRTFYNMNNMVFAAAGNFDPQKTLAILEESIADTKPITILRGEVDEPQEVSSTRVCTHLPVSLPQFCIGFKLSALSGKARLVAEMAYTILCELLVGEGSPLYREFYDTGLVAAGDVGTEVFSGNGYFSVLFEGESQDPDLVYQKIKAEIVRLQKDGISDEDFTLAKRAIYGRLVRGLASVDAAANALFGSALSGLTLFDSIDTVATLDKQQTMDFLSQIRLDCSTLSIVFPLSHSD